MIVMEPITATHLSVDLWDTILRRHCHPDEVKLHTAQRMLHLLHPYLKASPPSTMELFRTRQRIEAEIGNREMKEGFDDEYEIEEVLGCCILDLVGKRVEEEELIVLVDIIVQSEIDQEIAVTYLDQELISLLDSYEFEKLHIISDFYMSSDKVRRILQAHSFPYGVENFFLSCDSKLNKRSGRLYKYVCSEIGVAPESFLHIGDNRLVDVEMAVKCGLQALHFKGKEGSRSRKRNQDFFSLRQERDKGSDALLLGGKQEKFSKTGGRQERLRAFGRYMSPLFTGFALYIQELCMYGGHEQVHFFTREGRFFQKVFDRAQQHRVFSLPSVESSLLPVSRLASFFPSLQEIGPKDMMRLWSQYHTQSVNSMLQSLGLNPEEYLPFIRGNNFDPDEMVHSPWQDERFMRLFNDDQFLAHLKREQAVKLENLTAYFQECGFGKNAKAFIVDIGWRGTIQDNLAHIYPDLMIEGCYIGLQKFFNSQPKNSKKFSYIADENNGGFHLMLKHVMPFEMLCFSEGGSAIGYRKGKTGETFAEFQVDQDEDRFYREWIGFFQEGVLEGVDNVCKKVAQHGISIQELRNDSKILAGEFIANPPLIICQAFNAFKQDDTFGMARTIFPGELSFRLTDRIFARISSNRRERFLSDLENSCWPQCLFRSEYCGIFYKLECLKRWFADHGLR